MARISTYAIDSTIEGSDKLLGTDANSNSSLATKNYTIDSLKEYINGASAKNIPDEIPLGFALTVNREGTDYERALVRTLASSVETNVVLKSTTVNTGCDVYLNTLGTGQVFLIIRDYNDGQFAVDYDLNDFALNSATFTGTIGGVAHSGTVTSFNAPDFSNSSPSANVSQYVTNGNNIYTEWMFDVTLSAGEVYTGGQVAFTEFTFLTGSQRIETQAIGSLKVTRDLQVPDGNVVIGTLNPGTDPRSLTVYGSINVPNAESSVVFGQSPNQVSFGTNGDGLIVSGTADTTVTNSTRFTQDIIKDTNSTSSDGRTIMGQNTFTAIATDGTRSVLSSTGVELQDNSGNPLTLQQVAGNVSVGSLNNQGYLTSIKIDGNYFDVPQLASGVAEVLPGLSETLAGPSTDIDTGRFFYGIQTSAGALFQAATSPATLSTPESISTNTTSITVATGNKSDVNSMFTSRPSGQVLYFVESTYNTAFPSQGTLIEDTVVNIYQVVSYDNTTGILILGKQGFGTINISTSTFNIDSEIVKLNTIPQASKPNFLYYDTATKAVSHNPLSISGAANGATYDFGGNTDVPVVSIDFDNLQISAPANGVVTLKQGYAYGGSLGDTGSHVVSNWYYYILDNITANKSLTLPAGIEGTSIKFTNLNGYDASGNYSAPSYNWTINPAGSDKIMKATSLAVQNGSVGFELFYTNATIGWVINGKN
jgi:hypothetical protein